MPHANNKSLRPYSDSSRGSSLDPHWLRMYSIEYRMYSIEYIGNTVELEWLEQLWDHENMFETGVGQANES